MGCSSKAPESIEPLIRRPLPGHRPPVRAGMGAALLLLLTSCGGGGGGGGSDAAAPVASSVASMPAGPTSASAPASQASPGAAASAAASSPPAGAASAATPPASSPSSSALGLIGGYVAAVPEGSSTVTLSAVAADGSLTGLAQTGTSADGSYGFAVAPAIGTVVMISASGGSYRDASTGSTLSMSVPMRAIGVWTGQPLRVSPNVFSEVAVRSIESSSAPDWSAAGAQAANLSVAGTLGADTLVDFRPVDLGNAAALAGATDVDKALSSMLTKASAYGALLDTDPGTSLATMTQSLSDLLLNEPDDD